MSGPRRTTVNSRWSRPTWADELEPADSFAYQDHEQVFVVLEATATFETGEGTVEVGPGGAIGFDREEFQRGWNRGEDGP